METTNRVSKSRTYVMVCNKIEGDGFFFKLFRLPENIENNINVASHYFFNHVDLFNYSTKGCFTFEEYQDLRISQQEIK